MQVIYLNFVKVRNSWLPGYQYKSLVKHLATTRLLAMVAYGVILALIFMALSFNIIAVFKLNPIFNIYFIQRISIVDVISDIKHLYY